MRHDAIYLEDVIEAQGDVFEIAENNGCDPEVFAEMYLRSKVRRFIDNGSAYHCNLSGSELWRELGMSGGTDVWYAEEMSRFRFLGEMYAMLQFAVGVPSSAVLRHFPVQKLLKSYDSLCNMDIETAAEMIMGAADGSIEKVKDLTLPFHGGFETVFCSKTERSEYPEFGDLYSWG